MACHRVSKYLFSVLKSRYLNEHNNIYIVSTSAMLQNISLKLVICTAVVVLTVLTQAYGKLGEATQRELKVQFKGKQLKVR